MNLCVCTKSSLSLIYYCCGSDIVSPDLLAGFSADHPHDYLQLPEVVEDSF